MALAEQIFAPFFTTRTRGTGLGLAICRQMASAMGGRLEVHSREGEGSRFTIILPLVALFGGIALMRMPMQLTPEVQVPTITVQTRWPGASPQEVEQEIAAMQAARNAGDRS